MTRYKDDEGYIHVFKNRMVIYGGMSGERCQPPTPATVIDCDVDSRELLRDLSRIAAVLRDMGWDLGVDGWRWPLDKNSGIVVTAHLIQKEAKDVT